VCCTGPSISGMATAYRSLLAILFPLAILTPRARPGHHSPVFNSAVVVCCLTQISGSSGFDLRHQLPQLLPILKLWEQLLASLTPSLRQLITTITAAGSTAQAPTAGTRSAAAGGPAAAAAGSSSMSPLAEFVSLEFDFGVSFLRHIAQTLAGIQAALSGEAHLVTAAVQGSYAELWNTQTHMCYVSDVSWGAHRCLRRGSGDVNLESDPSQFDVHHSSNSTDWISLEALSHIHVCLHDVCLACRLLRLRWFTAKCPTVGMLCGRALPRQWTACARQYTGQQQWRAGSAASEPAAAAAAAAAACSSLWTSVCPSGQQRC
jgi:hypothetical protein